MVELHKKEQELIDYVMNEFDFSKCSKVMQYLNWTWGLTNQVPTIEDLKASALDRIHNAIEVIKDRKKISYEYPTVCSSGGLQATVFINKYKRITNVTLEFVLTEWSSD